VKNRGKVDSSHSTKHDGIKTSVVIAVTTLSRDVACWCRFLAKSFRDRKEPFEILLLDIRGSGKITRELMEVRDEVREVRILSYKGKVDPSVALFEGFERSTGERVLTISPETEVACSDAMKVLDQIGPQCDFACGYRQNRRDPFLKRVQSRLYNILARWFTGAPFHDLNTGIMAMKSEVAGNITFHGDVFPVFPLLVYHRGFIVREVPVSQRKPHAASVYFGWHSYLNRFLDLIVLFYLIRFTLKPLRFFGSIGLAVFLAGFAIDCYLLIVKLMENPIAHRPLLLLGTLLIVLGIQTFSLGLIGEIIIFTHARKMRSFHIGQIIE
jgi:hypothetical protein